MQISNTDIDVLDNTGWVSPATRSLVKDCVTLQTVSKTILLSLSSSSGGIIFRSHAAS